MAKASHICEHVTLEFVPYSGEEYLGVVEVKKIDVI